MKTTNLFFLSIKQLHCNVPALLGAALLLGCGSHEDHAHEHSHHEGHHAHTHAAPHGGTMVVFGKEACHLEFVHDSEAGSLTIYAIQFHPKETLMKLPMPSIRVKAKTEDAEHVLECQAVVNPTFGNTAERSSEYAAQAEWLKTPTAFEGEVVFLKLEGGAEFSNKTFQFPKSP